MGRLARRITAASELPSTTLTTPAGWLLDALGGGKTATGKRITPEGALGVPAVYQGLRILSALPASLPLRVIRRLPDDRGAMPARDHRNFRLLYNQPNRWQTSYQWRVAMGMSLHLRGNAYSSLIWGPDGQLQEIHWLHPDRVQVYLDADGYPLYHVCLNPSKPNWTWLSRFEMHHLWTETTDGYTGITALEACREHVALTLGVSELASRFIGGGGQVSGILSIPPNMGAEEKAAAKLSWQEAHQGLGNAGKTAVIGADVKFEPLSMKLVDAQWAEMHLRTKEDIATMLGLPGDFLAMSGAQMGGVTGVEQRFLQALILRFDPILDAWEQAIQRDMFTPEELDVIYPRFDRRALLRTDILTRYRVYAIGRQTSILSPNECRAQEELNPYDGGDSYDKPVNMQPVAGGTQPNNILGLDSQSADLDARIMAAVRAALGESHA